METRCPRWVKSRPCKNGMSALPPKADIGSASLCGSINVHGRPWVSKPLPIDYGQCCSDRLNSLPIADIPLLFWDVRLTPKSGPFGSHSCTGAKHVNGENLSAKTMDRLGNLGAWHLVMPVSMDASIRARSFGNAKCCTTRSSHHFGRSNRAVGFSRMGRMD